MSRKSLKAGSSAVVLSADGPNKKKSPETRKRKGRSGFFFNLFRWFIILAIWGGIALACVGLWFGYDLPDIHRLAHSNRKASVTLLARDGSIIATYGDLYGNFLELKDLPSHVPMAILAIEDRRFFSHFGIDIPGILRALWINWRAGSVVQGGSTITQQLAKNFLLGEGLYSYTDRTLRRKIQELILALWLEMHFTKQQILSIYLNRVYLGAGAWGIDAASRKYFGIPARHLSVYQGAVIAGLLKAPSRYSPTNNPDLADERARLVIESMVAAGFLTSDRIGDIAAERQKLATLQGTSGAGQYFADWVFETLPGLVGNINQDLVVQTTLDPVLQIKAGKYLRNVIMTEGFAANVHQAALVSITPNGAVRAMAGGIDYAKSQFNRAVQAKRQIGSTFKVFVYLSALESGMTPETEIEDSPIKIGNWMPKNYKWESRGIVTLRTALAFSLNTPVIRLARSLGLKRVQGLARRLGFTSPQPDDLTIALGAGQGTLLELTAAYAAIANHGFGVFPYGITQIHTRDGKIVYQRHAQGAGRVIEPGVVLQILSMLRSVMEIGTGRKIALDRPCAGKSGTTQKYRDAWFVGFTPDIVTGVWMGNDDETPMESVSGGMLPGLVWHQYMSDIHMGLPKKNFPDR